MKSENSTLRNKHTIINDKSVLIYENENTYHGVKNNQDYIFFDCGTMAIGRIASLIANVLLNKYDTDHSAHNKHHYKIVLYNCKNFILTGNKLHDRKYLKYTGYPGGQREINPFDLYNKNPRTYFENVISRMLNKNKSRQSKLNRILYFLESPDVGVLKMQKDDNIIQKTVNRIIAEYKSKEVM